jgi:hypothetical protein
LHQAFRPQADLPLAKDDEISAPFGHTPFLGLANDSVEGIEGAAQPAIGQNAV